MGREVSGVGAHRSEVSVPCEGMNESPTPRLLGSRRRMPRQVDLKFGTTLAPRGM